jgi:DNA-binding NtrC family response regulator
MAYDWQGNVRELENTVERALILYRSGELALDGFVSTRPDTTQRPEPTDQEEIPLFDEMARQVILKAIRKAEGRIGGPQGAAALLGLNRGTLRGKMKKLGIG